MTLGRTSRAFVRRPGSRDNAELFHRLQASRNRGAGATGSGLAVARQVVEGYGGALRRANRPGGGLLATARLPREGANGIGGRQG